MKLGYTIEDARRRYPELSDEILEDLSEWCEERNLPGVPSEQLALFAHSRYFDREAAKRCMSVYYRMRATVPEFFADRDPRSDYLQHSLRVLQFAALPVPDERGRKIIFHRLADARPSSYVFNDGIKLLGMTIDASLYREGCSPGYVLLFDMRGAKLGHLARLSMSSIRKFFEYYQEGLPIRLRGIHVLNAVWFMGKVMALIRPFLKKELFDMLHLYTGDVSEVYEHIPRKCLPRDYGGDLDCVENLHEAHCAALDQLRDYFLEEERLFRGWSEASRKSPLDPSAISGSVRDS